MKTLLQLKFSFMLWITLFSSLYATAQHAGVKKPPRTITTTNVSTTNNNTKSNSDTYTLPYNRIIKSAGSVIRFGNPELENHSLACTLLSDEKTLVIEDRYGIALVDISNKKIIARWSYYDDARLSSLMSTFSGIKAVKMDSATRIYWSAANGYDGRSAVMQAIWDGVKLSVSVLVPFSPKPPALVALPNEVDIRNESGNYYLYVVLNGNNELVKIKLTDASTVWSVATGVAPYGLTVVNNKIYVSNWGGPQPTDTTIETAGVPWGQAYINHSTGATLQGSVSVINQENGQVEKEIQVGLHPSALLVSPDKQFVYVANANSDNISVINTSTNMVIDSIAVNLFSATGSLSGNTPNALAIDSAGTTLYVANGLDNAIAVVRLGGQASQNGKGTDSVLGFIPTEAYPAAIAYGNHSLFVANLEAEGAIVNSNTILDQMDAKSQLVTTLPRTIGGAYNAHHQLASVSIIPIPDAKQLQKYTADVKAMNFISKIEEAGKKPRNNMAPKPLPERIGEPSVFKHVVYIIKENRTYDQILGDMPQGDGKKELCVFGDSITPNQHQLAKDFLLLDNYKASGKSSAEGHQWTDESIVSDYVEKNVRAWFRSYPHVQTDALVYSKEGFIWNNALDHGKTVKIYGEACIPDFDNQLGWTQIYELYKKGKPFNFKNVSTISRVRPILSTTYPGYDSHRINDQLRAEAFIKELHEYENDKSDNWPQLIVMALPNDHTGGMMPGLPTPRAMVADNDLALGRIIEAITHSRFWDSTVVFVTEDDSQDGWDHVSSYRTTGFVISAYSVLNRAVHTDYNQTCMVRTIEQILGIPPMNAIDATALPMYDCFSTDKKSYRYKPLRNKIPLDEMNKSIGQLKGKSKEYALLSMKPEFAHIDGGDDDIWNRIIWFSTMGDKKYPGTAKKK